MKREDFHKGQTVYVYLVGNAARYKKTVEERIEEWEVSSVGKKYLTAKRGDYGLEIKFDMENNFCQVTNLCKDYILYLTEEDLRMDLWRMGARKIIQKCANGCSPILKKLNDEELETVYDIFSKYLEEGSGK